MNNNMTKCKMYVLEYVHKSYNTSNTRSHAYYTIQKTSAENTRGVGRQAEVRSRGVSKKLGLGFLRSTNVRLRVDTKSECRLSFFP